MYIKVQHLQYIHYFYFTIGLFSLSNSILIGMGSPFSIFLIAFYAIFMVISWLVAIGVRRMIRDYFIIDSAASITKHVLLSVLASCSAVVMWVYLDQALIVSVGIVSVNYFALFMAFVWYVFYKTKMLEKVLQSYNNRVLKKCKGLFITTRDRKGMPKLVSDNDIRDYRYSSNGDVDSNLLSIWTNREDEGKIMEIIGEIEIILATKKIELLKRYIVRASKIDHVPKELKDMDKRLLNLESRLMGYERFYHNKIKSKNPGSE
jgi:hypothetical protein